MKLVIAMVLAGIFSSASADVIGRYEAKNNGLIDFKVLTYTRGITLDARLDPKKDSRVSALQTVQLSFNQYHLLFETEQEVKDLRLSGVFEATANASGDNANRTVTIVEVFEEGGKLITEKTLKLNIVAGEIMDASLVTRQRRGLLNIIPLWMGKVFKKSIEVNKVEDGLLLRNDSADLCRVTEESKIKLAARGGSTAQLQDICN